MSDAIGALWDEIEQLLASDEVRDRVEAMRSASREVLDTESRERLLVGDVLSTIARAGQIGREVTVGDHGIDAEIEFKDDEGRATGKRVYLQLKSGDSRTSGTASVTTLAGFDLQGSPRRLLG